MMVFLTACNSKNENTHDINVLFTVSQLSEEDFTFVGMKDGNKDDFRKVHFSLTIENSASMLNRTVNIPDLKEIMNSFDIERYWYGDYSAKDNATEDVEYTYDIMFLSKDLSDEDIKTIFEDRQVVIVWNDKKDIVEKEVYKLSELILFK